MGDLNKIYKKSGISRSKKIEQYDLNNNISLLKLVNVFWYSLFLSWWFTSTKTKIINQYN